MNNSGHSLIAPCGMNCGICLGYLRQKNHCSGCRTDAHTDDKARLNCIIKNCENIKLSSSGFCYECAKYPCRRLKQLDKRYRTRYTMSMLENLENIKKNGLENFERSESERWRCSACGGTICVHRARCFNCGAERPGSPV